MNTVMRLLHYLVLGVIGAMLLYTIGYVFSVLAIFGGELYGDDHQSWFLFLAPLLLLSGAIIGVFIGWLLFRRYNVPNGGELHWWLGRPVKVKMLVAVVVIVVVAVFCSHASFVFGLPTFWRNPWGLG